MADENQQNTGSDQNSAGQPTGDAASKPVKKPKTPRQIERERERRKRRRKSLSQKKKLQAETVGEKEQKDKNVSTPEKGEQKPSKDVNSEGKDIPMMLPSDAGTEKDLPPPDLSIRQMDQMQEGENAVEMGPDADVFIEETPETGLTEPKEEEAETEKSEEKPAEDQIAPPIHPESQEEESPTPPEPWDISLGNDENAPADEQGQSQTGNDDWMKEAYKDNIFNDSSENEEQPVNEEESKEEEPNEIESEENGQPIDQTEFQSHESQPHEEEFPEETVPQADQHEEYAHENEPPIEGEVVQNGDDEKLKEQENLDKAREITEGLISEYDDELDEAEQKPDIFGRLFDLIQHIFSKKKKETADAEISEINPPEPPKPPRHVNFSWLFPVFKFLFTILVIGALAIGAYWLGSSLKLYDRLNQLFTTQPGLELQEGDNSKVVQDPQMLRKFGFETLLLFGKNKGNIHDLAYNVFFVASYYGHLKEPIFYGETGITAAIYYGFGKEAVYLKNRFIYYVKFLTRLRNAYAINVYDVMDGKLNRDLALKKYTDETNDLFTEGNNLRKEILVQVDDLTVSLNTLTPDKDRYETDFFAALDNLEAENSNMLIEKFIEVTKRQVEIKAKLAAMTRLAKFYEDILLNLKIRLEAIDKNRAALVNGIQVTEIPGANLNLVKTE